MYYYMVQSRGAKLDSNTVISPTDYCRLSDGSIERDGTNLPSMGPVSQAYRFESRLSAARVAAKLSDPVIHELPGVPHTC
jgi:hypothetical protein